MPELGDLNLIQKQSNFPVAENNTTSPAPVPGVLNFFRSVSNTVINRFTVHAAPSSPWNYKRNDNPKPTSSSFSPAPKNVENKTFQSLKDDYKKNASQHRNNPSAFKSVTDNTREQCKQYHYDKASRPSR